MLSRTAAAVSPTALYTGAVWARNGLSHPGFATRTGTAMWAALQPPQALLGLVGGPSLDALLLARHHAIDEYLREEIESGRIGQVVEIAAGLSPRGWRFTREFDDLTYVEADLPGMAARKSEILERHRLGAPRHHVRTIDAFADDGPDSLAAVVADLEPSIGTAVITEGLINYFSLDDVLGLWPRIAGVLANGAGGVYLSDIHLDVHDDVVTRVASAGIMVFVRGKVFQHFGSEEEALGALETAGFTSAELRRPSDLTDDPERVRRRGVDRNLIIVARVD